MSAVLIIDDNHASRILPSMILTKIGVKTYEAKTGLEAMQILAQHTEITHALVDISMPDMDGKQLLENIRSNQQWADIKIVAYTAGAFPDNVALLRGLGFDEVLVKPIDYNGLLDALVSNGLKIPG